MAVQKKGVICKSMLRNLGDKEQKRGGVWPAEMEGTRLYKPYCSCWEDMI